LGAGQVKSIKISKNPELLALPYLKRYHVWLKKNLFATPIDTLMSITIIFILWKMTSFLWDWLLTSAVWVGTAENCRQAQGACIAFLLEKAPFILFGFYPQESIWRPLLLFCFFILLIAFSKKRERWNLNLGIFWCAFLALFFIFMDGSFIGLKRVGIEKWGGLPLTLMLAVLGIGFSYPLGIALALGRKSKLPVLKGLSIIYIESIRGVPLISLLFMSSVMMPLFLPEGVTLHKLLRAQLAIIFFSSAYMAEVVRGGLEAIPQGQWEAARALGLNKMRILQLVVLPQALRVVIAPTVNTFIGLFKDTSLVIIIALFDLMYTAKASLKDPEWLGFSVEAYMFVALIYFVFCFSMSKYSRRLEREMSKG